jgi:Gpi18-like mannosyltransferase
MRQRSTLWADRRAQYRRIPWIDVAAVIIGLGMAVLVRLPLLDFKSSDFFNSLRPWYVTIRSMGFSAFATDFTTYNPPYLYQLYLIARFFPDISNLLAIKIPSLFTDFVCAYFVYKIVALKYPTRQSFPIIAALTFLFAPTVVLNSAFWGQADVLFTAPLIACLYFLMVRRNTLAFIAFGISLAFKLQAIFLAPLLFGLFLRGKVSWRHFLLVFAVLFIAILPAWIAGRPLVELIKVYAGQVQQYQLLEMSAPTVYTWMPDVGLTQRFFTVTGVIFTAMLGLIFAFFIYKSEAKLTVPLLLKLALVSVMFVPFFLPKMHDRYFYPADVISIMYAFFFPQYFFVPVVVIVCSFFAYHPTLFGVDTVPMGILAVGMFVMLVIVAKDAIMELYAGQTSVDAVHTQ